MKIHIINAPFMTREGQFEKDKHTMACGIEVNALKFAGEYRIYFGKNRKIYYDITYQEALTIVRQYGSKNTTTKRNGKLVFILPVFAMRMGLSKWNEEEHEKKEAKRIIINQAKLFAILFMLFIPRVVHLVT